MPAESSEPNPHPRKRLSEHKEARRCRNKRESKSLSLVSATLSNEEHFRARSGQCGDELQLLDFFFLHYPRPKP